MRANYPRYVLAVLLASYTMNSLDRAIIAVLLDPIGREFNVSDTQLGLLTGLAFAAVYSILGIPLAAYGDRTGHRGVLAASVLVWSVATMLCGLAGGFAWLLLARAAVAAGESGATPSSHSLISEYFPLHRRATAIAVFSLGAPLGAALAGLWGGYGNEIFGWRMTIMAAGLPGLLLAPLIWWRIQETPRSRVPATATTGATAAFIKAARHLLQRRSFRHLFLACSIHGMSNYGTTTFNVTFLVRSYGWDTGKAGQVIAFLGILASAGAFLGGFMADRLTQRTNDSRWLLWVPAVSTLAAVPLHAASYLTTDTTLVLIVLPMASLLSTMFFGPAFSVGQALTVAGARAMVASVLLFGMTMVGLGLGPLLIAMISDALAPVASEHSLRYALLLAPAVNIWAAIHFFLAAKTMRDDVAA
jgi:MFS family permease